MAATDPPGPDAPIIMQLVYWGGLGLGALVLAALGYKQKNAKPQEVASIAGAVVDNRALEGLLNELKGLREDLRSNKDELSSLRGAFSHEADMRKHEAERLKNRVDLDAERLKLKTDFEAERRMQQLLEMFEKAKGARGD